jgi:uncharacterized membrane protein
MIKKKTKKKTNLEISAKNIETIVRLEEEDEQQISHADWISDSIGGFAGTTYFVVLQLALIIAWLIVNLGLISSVPVLIRVRFRCCLRHFPQKASSSCHSY